MVSAVVARVAAHSEILELASYSSVPIINALSDDYHPLQALADILTIKESAKGSSLSNLKVAWVGDASNVFTDLAFACKLLDISVSISTPVGYETIAESSGRVSASARCC